MNSSGSSDPVRPSEASQRSIRSLPVEQRKPYSAITVQIDRLTSEQYEEDDFSGIIDLIEVIRIQASGPTETARAIRKKLYVKERLSFARFPLTDDIVANMAILIVRYAHL